MHGVAGNEDRAPTSHPTRNSASTAPGSGEESARVGCHVRAAQTPGENSRGAGVQARPAQAPGAWQMQMTCHRACRPTRQVRFCPFCLKSPGPGPELQAASFAVAVLGECQYIHGGGGGAAHFVGRAIATSPLIADCAAGTSPLPTARSPRWPAWALAVGHAPFSPQRPNLAARSALRCFLARRFCMAGSIAAASAAVGVKIQLAIREQM